MAKQNAKLNIVKARRRVRMRSALLLTLGVCLLTWAVRLLPAALPLWLRWTLQTLMTIAAFGGGAYLGLCVLDGDHARLVPLRMLSRAQMLWLSLLGVMAVCPAALVRDLLDALTGSMAAASGGSAASVPLAAMLLKSAVLAPVCEELFFRGYLLGALKREGALRAAVVVSLCFALVHAGGLGAFGAHVLLGLLLCWVTLGMQSLLAPVLVHMGYNAALILLGGMGLGGLLTGWSLISCAVRLAGCAAFAAVLRRAYTARRAGGTFSLWDGGRLSRREIVLLACTALLLAATLIMGG